MHRAFPNHSHPYYRGPCQMCGDPNVPVEPHDEDYSTPYLWEQPAMYAVCKRCHRQLHRRFEKPIAWKAYKLHLKRGGWSSDLNDSKIIAQLKSAEQALALGQPAALPSLRPSPAGPPWWDNLTTDPASLTAAAVRPRP